jgi:GT2 family glycosyltransferase
MCRYVELEQNIGRARIRNLFLQYARYDYMLFLDCDSLPPEGFLSRYAEVLKQKPRVVCGGRVYAAGSDDREHHLRYAYGTRCESHTAAERCQNPYKSFMTNNFIVHREVLEAIPFDERIALYGHEDTLFGYCLMQRHVPIVHIENPVINGDVETNSEFLRKTREGVRSLADIYEWKKDDREFLKQVSLLNFYSKVQKLGMAAIIGWVYRLSQPLLEKGFINGKHVSMRAFAFYKLGLFIQLLGNKPIYK